ncbi:aminopeptidase I zinc metalloprotease (M18) domain-containing protein [Ditylenchus destructor]|uniref:Aspartyl aminopeptidase n=1 Tax=Ditylenchus destructor TaxID=166010 RepID=A0AAD4QYZ0_9BILA|nr:aminopeptidase I zinc metalloprotease (M18) domain-containing protein [Ditylenchus destructor]
MQPSIKSKNVAKSFLNFLNKSVTPFHAVQSCVEILQEAGFKEVREKENFKVKPGDKLFIKKNHSTIFAFAVGGQYKPGAANSNHGFSIVVAHTDSPCLRMKPVSKKSAEKFLQVGVSPYGGGLWRTWFDRDLSLAGQVVFKRKDSDAILHKLVNVRRPILNIPNLAIHLTPDPTKPFEFNKETHLTPILATMDESAAGSKCPEGENREQGGKLNCSIVEDHHEQLLNVIAEEAGCGVEELVDLDMYLYDVQEATLTGLREEFISGARLDNLLGTYTAITGLVNSLQDPKSFETDPNVRLVACYDHEEVGSSSAQGAASSFTQWLMRRLSVPNNGEGGKSAEDPQTCFERAIGNSYMISADQAHACHPNYAQSHEDKHKPAFHKGVVVKINVNQSYATSVMTHAVLKVIADKAQVPLQKFVIRNDSRCGSTVGPILATRLGLQTVDVGCPQMAMHSIRELADVTSVEQAVQLYSKFFETLPSVLASIQPSPEGSTDSQ